MIKNSIHICTIMLTTHILKCCYFLALVFWVWYQQLHNLPAGNDDEVPPEKKKKITISNLLLLIYSINITLWVTGKELKHICQLNKIAHNKDILKQAQNHQRTILLWSFKKPNTAPPLPGNFTAAPKLHPISIIFRLSTPRAASPYSSLRISKFEFIKSARVDQSWFLMAVLASSVRSANFFIPSKTLSSPE